MRRMLYAFAILSCLLGLALPIWGETATPAVSAPVPGGFCPTAATSGGTSLQDIIPAPELKTGTCGSCQDCFGSSPGSMCVDENGENGICFGLKEGNTILLCPDHLYRCVCIAFVS